MLQAFIYPYVGIYHYPTLTYIAPILKPFQRRTYIAPTASADVTLA